MPRCLRRGGFTGPKTGFDYRRRCPPDLGRKKLCCYRGAVNSPESSSPSLKGRGIAATGELYHATNGKGVVGRDWLTRVRIDDVRCTINLGPDKDFARQLDVIVRLQLRAGKSLTEVKEFAATALRQRHLPESPLSPTAPAPQANHGAPLNRKILQRC